MLKVLNFGFLGWSFLNSLISFAFGIILARSFSVEVFASYQVALGMAGIPMLIIPFSFEYILPKIIKSKLFSIEKAVKAWFYLTSIILFFVLLIALLMKLELAKMIIILAMSLSSIGFGALYELNKNIGEYAFILFAHSIIQFTLVIILSIYYELTELNLAILLLVIAIMKTAVFGYRFKYYMNLSTSRETLDLGCLKYILKHSLPMIGISFLGFFYGGFIRIAHSSNTELLSQIGIVFQLVSLFTFWLGLMDRMFRSDYIANGLGLFQYIVFSSFPILTLLAAQIFNLNIFDIIWGENYSVLNSSFVSIIILLLGVFAKSLSSLLSNRYGFNQTHLILFMSCTAFFVITLSYVTNIRILAFLIGSSYLSVLFILRSIIYAKNNSLLPFRK